MKQLRILTALALLGLAGLLAGCGADTIDPSLEVAGEDDFESLDFNAPYGGLTASDEDVAFADEGLKALFIAEGDEDIDDPVARDPWVLDLEERSRHERPERERPKFTYVRLRWGMLRGPEDTTTVEGPCDMTDWTGTLRVDEGAIVVKRLVKFEWPADHVVFPRLDRRTVAFVSKTWCHYDGLVIQIAEPPEGESMEVRLANKLHIDTPAFKGEFIVADLAGMNEVVEVDEMGNRFQVNGFRLDDIERCPKGFLSGRYRLLRHDRPDTVRGDDGEVRAVRHGVFAGAWYTLHGRIHGFMRGGYGVDAAGRRVFVGKFIDRTGRFRGLIRGGWEPAGDEVELASFRGEWVTRNGEVEGRLGGKSHPVPGYPGGFYEGRWTTLCDDEAESQVP